MAVENLPQAFVCGYPIRHSRSPIIHSYWLKQYGIPGAYTAVEMSVDAFPNFISRLPEHNFVGGNITLPHKEAALVALDMADEPALRIGAVNTVWLEGGRLFGTNTDWHGFAANMDDHVPGWDGVTTAVLLGAGGASRGVIYALAQRGISDIRIVNRSRARAEALAASYAGASVAGWDELPDLLPRADLLINTTSLGMDGNEGPAVEIDLLPREAIVSDIVYVPLMTPLLDRANQRGLRCVDGLGMLLHQAAPGFEKWFGIRPAVTAELRQVIVDDLERHRR